MWIVVACYSWNDVANGGRKPALVLLQPLNGEVISEVQRVAYVVSTGRRSNTLDTQGH